MRLRSAGFIVFYIQSRTLHLFVLGIMPGGRNCTQNINKEFITSLIDLSEMITDGSGTGDIGVREHSDLCIT